jgi:hypothetical protein
MGRGPYNLLERLIGGYTSILSDDALSDEDIARMRSSDAAIVLAGRTWYRDVFGDLHWTDFCRHPLATGAIAACAQHNDHGFSDPRSDGRAGATCSRGIDCEKWPPPITDDPDRKAGGAGGM